MAIKTKNEAAAFAEVLLAYSKGETIQVYTSARWMDSNDLLLLDMSWEKYRVKRTPKEKWLVEYPSGAGVVCGSLTAAEIIQNKVPGSKIVRYREVIGD